MRAVKYIVFGLAYLLLAVTYSFAQTIDNYQLPETKKKLNLNSADKLGIEMIRSGMQWNHNKNRDQVILDSLFDDLKKYEDRGMKEAATVTKVKIGLIYSDNDNVREGLPYLIQAVTIYDQVSKNNIIGGTFSLGGSDDADGIVASAKSKSTSYTLPAEELKRCVSYLLTGQNLCKQQNNTDAVAEINEALAKGYQLTGDYKKAFEAQEQFRLYRDSMYAIGDAEKKAKIEEKDKELQLNALRYEYEKKQAQAKSEKEKQQLKYEEELKRNQINYEYAKRQASLEAARKRDALIAKAAQEKKDAAARLKLQRQQLITYASLAGLLLLAGFVWYVVRNNKLLSKEKHKSETLLLNILPSEIADELKERGATTAKHFDAVSVLFTDFVAFTKAGERMSSQQLVEELHTCFKAFDDITGKYSIEKIKTIGDAYLAVSGLPLADACHAENTVKAALDILAFMKSRQKSLGDQTFEIRIGIHSGDVVAGIVGVKKFAYDIWGDTVNTAARMEQKSEAGKINISQSTYELVKDKFKCTFRGEIEAKNKGMLKMYFVEG